MRVIHVHSVEKDCSTAGRYSEICPQELLLPALVQSYMNIILDLRNGNESFALSFSHPVFILYITNSTWF